MDASGRQQATQTRAPARPASAASATFTSTLPGGQHDQPPRPSGPLLAGPRRHTGVVAGSALAAAPSASATDPACKYDGRTYNACLRFDDAGWGFWHANVGIDVYMSEQYAREVIACGADFKATLYAHDSTQASLVSNLWLKPGWPAAGPGLIGAEFDARYLHHGILDEDPGADADELYASISFYDCHTRQRRSFTTGIHRRDFSL